MLGREIGLLMFARASMLNHESEGVIGSFLFVRVWWVMHIYCHGDRHLELHHAGFRTAADMSLGFASSKPTSNYLS